MMMGAPVFALTGYAAASHVIPRGFAGRCLGWLRVQIYRGVALCLLDSNGGMRVAWVWRLHKTYKTYETYKIMVGHHVIPRGFACAAVWVASECRFTVG